MLRRAGANLIGVVLNNIPLKRSGYYGSYRYQYSSSYESDAGRARSSSAD
jgi:Mrp family chromosome partitioning ATPase